MAKKAAGQSRKATGKGGEKPADGPSTGTGTNVRGRGKAATLWSPKKDGFDFSIDNGPNSLLVMIADGGEILTPEPMEMHPDDADHLAGLLKEQAKHQRRLIKASAGRHEPA